MEMGEIDDHAYAAGVAALFAREPSRMVPDLERISTLSELLDRPDQAYPSVHVTGTNGKTTTSLMVSALLGALGLSAGTYTSPHLQDVRERIRVAGEPIDRRSVVDGLRYLEPFVAEVDARYPQRMTFFEILTALAYVHFADAPVDVGVFEVGLGGRWDATNLVRGDVAVLGRVALDHPELGTTVAQVAWEKAGIIKDGAVVVSAAQEPDAEAVIARAAAEHDARLVVAGRDFDVIERAPAVGGQLLTLRGLTGEHDELFVPLQGAHQATNAACALAAVEGFLGFAGALDTEVLRRGFAAVRSPGRLELVARQGLAPVLLDGAHNPAGARSLARALTEEFLYRHRVFVMGVLDDKDVEAMLAVLLPLAEHLIVVEAPSARTAPAERLAKAARAAGSTVELAEDVAAAVELATGLTGEGDVVVVTGSLLVVGAARDALGLPPA
jgi:dihydrofolate synthase / folylpolyglutamate synthase